MLDSAALNTQQQQQQPTASDKQAGKEHVHHHPHHHHHHHHHHAVHTQQTSQPQSNQYQQQILKQIDPQNDLFDQKNRQEIANMLRLVENDQQGVNLAKLAHKQKGLNYQSQQHVNQSAGLLNTKQIHEQFSFKVYSHFWLV